MAQIPFYCCLLAPGASSDPIPFAEQNQSSHSGCLLVDFPVFFSFVTVLKCTGDVMLRRPNLMSENHQRPLIYPQKQYRGKKTGQGPITAK